jgi:hypothetical protein
VGTGDDCGFGVHGALKVRRLVHSFSKATSLGVGVGITENLTNKIP